MSRSSKKTTDVSLAVVQMNNPDASSYLPKLGLEGEGQRKLSDPLFVNGLTLEGYKAFLPQSYIQGEPKIHYMSDLIAHPQLENYPTAMQLVCQHVLDDRTAYELLTLAERHRIAYLLFPKKSYLHALSERTDIGSLASLFRYHMESVARHQHWGTEEAFLYFWSFLSSATGQVKSTLFSLFSAYVKQGYFQLSTIFNLLERRQVRVDDFLAWVESQWTLAQEVLAYGKKRCIKICPMVEFMYQSSDCDIETFVRILCQQKDDHQQRRILSWRKIADSDFSEIAALTDGLITSKGGHGFFEFILYQGANELSKSIKISFLAESLLRYADVWTLDMFEKLVQIPEDLLENILVKLIKNPNGKEISITLLDYLDRPRLIHLSSLELVRSNGAFVEEIAKKVFTRWNITEQRKLRFESKITFDLLQHTVINNVPLFLSLKDFELISGEVFFRALYSFCFVEDISRLDLLEKRLNAAYPSLRGMRKRMIRFAKNALCTLLAYRRIRKHFDSQGMRENSIDHFLGVCSRKKAGPWQKWWYVSIDFFLGSPYAWFKKQMRRMLRQQNGTICMLNGLHADSACSLIQEIKNVSDGNGADQVDGGKMLTWACGGGNGKEDLFLAMDAGEFIDEKGVHEDTFQMH